jgi:hypothetical protein
MHARVVGKLVDETTHDRFDRLLGHSSVAELGPPPVTAQGFVQACPRSLRAELGADMAGNAADRLKAEVQKYLGGRPLGPPLLA